MGILLGGGGWHGYLNRDLVESYVEKETELLVSCIYMEFIPIGKNKGEI